MSALTRRALLRAAVGGGLATLGGLLFGCGNSADPELSEQDVAKWLGVALGTSPALAEIGRAYLSEHPAENDFEALRSAVFPARYENAAAFKQALQAAIQDDFAREEVVALQGWQLSLTEVRSCALLFLTTQPSAKG